MPTAADKPDMQRTCRHGWLVDTWDRHRRLIHELTETFGTDNDLVRCSPRVSGMQVCKHACCGRRTLRSGSYWYHGPCLLPSRREPVDAARARLSQLVPPAEFRRENAHRDTRINSLHNTPRIHHYSIAESRGETRATDS